MVCVLVLMPPKSDCPDTVVLSVETRAARLDWAVLSRAEEVELFVVTVERTDRKLVAVVCSVLMAEVVAVRRVVATALEFADRLEPVLLLFELHQLAGAGAEAEADVGEFARRQFLLRLAQRALGLHDASARRARQYKAGDIVHRWGPIAGAR